MAGEFFQSERGQIKAVEAQAQKEKKEKVSTGLQAKKDLLHNEVSKAGKMLADAEAKVTVPASKEKVSGYKKDISSTLKDIVNSGQQALKAENPDADLAVIDLLSGSLKSTLNTVKQYVPLFNDVEDAKGHAPKIEEKLKKARDAKEKNGLRSKEFNAAISEAEDLMGKAKDAEVYSWKPESLPADMKAILMSVLAPLKDQEAEIAGYRLERTEKSALEDDPNDPPEAKEHKAAMKILKPAKAAFDTAQVNMKKISDAVKDSEKKPESLDGISGTIDTSITDLGEVLKQLKTIDVSKIVDPEYVTLYDNTLQKVNLQLQELANLKVSLKTRELMTKGLTDEEKKYVTMDEKGNITKTPEFAKLPKDKQMALEAKFKLIEIEVAMELDEKTAGEKEKKMIEGRKKLMAGDPFGAKEDLLAYYNQEAKNTERDPVRFEQTKEMLKQIAKMELSQMVQRLVSMKASVKERYNNNVVGKTDFGTQTYQQAYDNIDDMARVIDAAEELIESGKCVTIEGAEAQLRKFEFPPNTVQGIQAMDEKAAEIKQRGNDELKKNKDDRIKREKDEVDRLEKSIKQLESGEIQTTLDGQPITVEYIQKRKEQLQAQRDKVTKTEGMSLEEVRAAELQPVELQLKKARLDKALKSWKAGFPVDISSNSWEVFDMFVQQRKLNDADPEVRKQAMLEEAQKARERGFTGLARQMYESYFAKQLQEGAKSVDKNAVREKTLKNPDVSKKLDQSLTTWKSDFKKQWGRDPEEAEVQEALGKMQNMVVSEAYNKEVKLSTYNMLEGASGPEAAEWKKIYGGTVAIENFGQGGVLTAFWTDEEWNALPVKVGVFTAVTIASGGLGSAVAAGTGMAARAVLGEIIVGRVLATAGGRAMAWAGSAAVEGAVFSAAQYEFNNMLLGNGYERFSAEYWKAMGHSIVTMGVLKGVGAGVGKLRSLAEAGNAGTFIEGGLTSVAKDAAWWAGKTAIEGGSLVGLDAGMAFLSGRHFTAKEAAKSFGENFIFSAAMGGVHEFMGQGAHEAPQEKKLVEEIQTSKAIEKYGKAQIEVDAAQAKLDKAKAEGKPTEKLEADLAAKKKAVEGAEGKVVDAEKAEGEARVANLQKSQKELMAKLEKQQKEGNVDPNLIAQIKTTETLLASLNGPEGSSSGPKLPTVDIGIVEKYAAAFMGRDAAEIAALKSKYPQYAEIFSNVEKSATPPDKSAVDTHYNSAFSDASSFPENLKAEGKSPKDVAGWIDDKGRVHYSAEYFKSEFGVDMATSKDGKNVFKVNGKEVGPIEFFGTPEGKAVFEKMKAVKTHEVTHRILEFTEGATSGELGKSLGKVVAENPEIAAEFAKRGEKPDFRSIQEFLCEVADGRVKLTPEAKKQIEAEIGKSIPDFTFAAVRKIDTRLLAANSPEVFERNMADAFTATMIAENPLLTDPAGKSAYDMMQIAIKAGFDPAAKMSKAHYEKAMDFANALERRNQANVLISERAKINQELIKNKPAYTNFSKLTGEKLALARKAEAEVIKALSEGDYKKAQQIKDSYAHEEGFYDALTYVESDFRFNKGNRELSILRARGVLDPGIRKIAQKSPEEIAAFVDDFNLTSPGFKKGPRVKICDLPGGKGSIEIDQTGQLIYMNPFEDAGLSESPKSSKAKSAEFDDMMEDLLKDMVSLPPRAPVKPKKAGEPSSEPPKVDSPIKPQLQVPRPKPRAPKAEADEANYEPIKPIPIIDVKGPPLPDGFNPKYEGTPLEQHERFRARMKIAEDAMSAEQVQEAFRNLDPSDKEILKANIDSMSPDQLVAVLQKKYTQFPDGARYYEGKLAGQGGIADVHLTLFYRPGEPKMKEAVVKTPRTHDNNGQPYSPAEYAARAAVLKYEAYNARRIMALQHGNPPKMLKAMRPLYVSDDRIVYEDAHAGGGKFSDYEHAVEDPRIGADVMWLGFADTLTAIDELHRSYDDSRSKALVHRDIKPENLAMAGMMPVEVIDAAGNKTVKYVGGEGRILDIGSVQDAGQMKADGMMIQFEYIDGSGTQQFVQLPLDKNKVNSGNFDAQIQAIARTFKVDVDTITVAPISGGVTEGYYDPKMILAIQEGKVPAYLQDYYALGASMENMGINGWNKFDKSGKFVGPVIAKEPPPAHKAEFERIVRGLKSYDPSNADYQYVHNTLGGLKGVAERMREWYK